MVAEEGKNHSISGRGNKPYIEYGCPFEEIDAILATAKDKTRPDENPTRS
jgi:hypothetical protein